MKNGSPLLRKRASIVGIAQCCHHWRSGLTQGCRTGPATFGWVPRVNANRTQNRKAYEANFTLMKIHRDDIIHRGRCCPARNLCKSCPKIRTDLFRSCLSLGAIWVSSAMSVQTHGHFCLLSPISSCSSTWLRQPETDLCLEIIERSSAEPLLETGCFSCTVTGLSVGCLGLAKFSALEPGTCI